MKILFVGEIVASPGRKAVAAVLPELIKEHQPDLILSNIENLSHGRGISEQAVNEMLNQGIQYFTGGDHIFWQEGTEDLMSRFPIIRPANYPDGTAGQGFAVIDLGSKGQVLLINLMGRTAFGGPFAYLEDPFRTADRILDQHKDQKFSAIIVDFHAESTSEKAAMGFYLDGRVDAVLGTHTHIPTADQHVLPKGTLFVTDVGMTGNIDSVLGVKKEIILKLMLTALNQRFEWEKSGRKAFRSVLLDTVDKTILRLDKLI
jgi:2',3'-cyclic-nucleotide 2'-phosphodiesterase